VQCIAQSSYLLYIQCEKSIIEHEPGSKSRNYTKIDAVICHSISIKLYLEAFYNEWLRLLDKELDIKLKSSSFTSLLSRYVNLLVELRTILREAGYPVYYIGWLFDSYVRKIMVFASIEKDFDLAPFDIMSVKGKTRLLHYHHNNGAKGKDEDKRQTLLIICAPINRFHIMDISQDRSVVKGLLSKGLDVYMLDWGYPTWEDSNLSLTDYVNYVKDVVPNIKDKTGTARISILCLWVFESVTYLCKCYNY